jgi:hypothetical protein
MIAWTIPRAKVLTGYTEETAGDSASSTVSSAQTVTGAGGITVSFPASGTTTTSGISYTSHGASGSTTYFSFFSSHSTAGTSDSPLYDPTSSAESFTTSSSGITTASLISVAAQTSTTTTAEYTFAVSLTTATTGSGWSYSSSSFFTVSTGATENTTSAQTGTVTLDATTTSSTVLSSGLADTILQAAGSEVIWYYSSITNWSGITAATDRATSTTRLTISPLVVLTALPKVTASTSQSSTGVAGNSSHSYSYADSTYQSQYTTTAPTSTISTFVLLGDLPNETLTFTPTIARSTTESFGVTLFYSDASNVEATDATTRVLSLATVSNNATPGTFYSGSLLTWDAPRTTTTAYSLTTTAPIALCEASQSSTSYTVSGQTTDSDFPGNDERSSFRSEGGYTSGKTIDQNTYLPQLPICGLTMGNILSQSKFVPRAAKVGTASGYWFVLDVSDTLEERTYVYDGRSFLTTLMPTTGQYVTYNSDSITFTKTTLISGQSATTTSSAILQVSGNSTTTVFDSGPIGIWGGSPAAGETFANVAGTDGVYRNRIGGETSSFRRGATTFSTSLPLSSFFPIQGLGPPLGQDVETRPSFGYWTEARNSTALPPTMPPNA